ncbi:MAG: cytochrome c-type biogenesis protein CcmH [Rhodospirillales bacterium]
MGWLLGTGPSIAVMPDEVLKDPALEARAREISKDLRCLVCQNQSIDDSDADLARDLRLIVRERLVAGDSNDAVKEYVVERYGDYVLLTPPVNAATILLWAGPGIILLLAVVIAGFSYRRHGQAAPADDGISDLDKARVEALLDDEGDGPGKGHS